MWKCRVLLCLGVLVSLLVLPVARAQAPGDLFTYAGNGDGAPYSGGYSGDGGRATAAELYYPNSVALDAAGNLYIADVGDYCVRKVTASTGIITTAAGVCGTSGTSADGGSATHSTLVNPTQVAVDSSGNLYIADSGDQRIRKVTTATGNISTIAGNGTQGYSGDGGAATSAQLSHPDGIGFDKAGNLYISDSYNVVIRKVTASTGIITTVAGNGTGGYSGDGGPATAANLYSPSSLAVDPAGDFYFLDGNNAVVRKVTASTGIITTVAGNNTWGFSGDGGPATKAQIYDAGGVGLDGAGNLYIADTYNQRIRRVDAASGVISTVAGDGYTVPPYNWGGYSGDGGPALNAELNVPTGVTGNGAGDLYIADSNNDRIRKVIHGGKVESLLSLAFPTSPELVGTEVTMTATVSGLPGSPRPTGTVTFSDGTNQLGTVPLNSQGIATFPTDSLAVGSYYPTATYSGDGVYVSSSGPASASYALQIVPSAAAAPTFTPLAGHYNSRLQVALNDSTPGVTIFYTTNGSTPIPPNTLSVGNPNPAGNGIVYTGAITVNGSETIKAVAIGGYYGAGYAVSPVSSASYTIHLPREASLTEGKWAWEDGGATASYAQTSPCGYGPGSIGLPGIYGHLHVPSLTNTPGSRRTAMTWKDINGNFWLFGGFGFDSTGHCAELNDLWVFNVTAHEWTWEGGSSTPSTNGYVAGVYGTQGKFAPGNTPGSREAAVTWTDADGRFWLFGGYGYDSAGTENTLNDLWEFNPAIGQWAWIGGSNLVNQAGIYGSQRTPTPANIPGARWGAYGWTDPNGTLWLFGGSGYDSAGAYDMLNDLWAYNPSSHQWTWMSGGNTVDQNGTYGTQGTGSTANTPGSRNDFVGWVDAQGNFWLFGGLGHAGPNGQPGLLNDLWEFSSNTLKWTWVSGLNTTGTYQNQNSWPGDTGVYGVLGVPQPGNTPGSRISPAAWTDAVGNLWLFGGEGYDAVGNSGIMNDLWEFVPSLGMWSWMGGSNTFASPAPGIYGHPGVADAANQPGARIPSGHWTDDAGNLWLFGGEGYDSQSNDQLLNDIWQYQLPDPPPSAGTHGSGHHHHHHDHDHDGDDILADR